MVKVSYQSGAATGPFAAGPVATPARNITSDAQAVSSTAVPGYYIDAAVEVFSKSFDAWLQGSVRSVRDDGTVHAEFMAPDGRFKEKVFPFGHPELRLATEPTQSPIHQFVTAADAPPSRLDLFSAEPSLPSTRIDLLSASPADLQKKSLLLPTVQAEQSSSFVSHQVQGQIRQREATRTLSSGSVPQQVQTSAAPPASYSLPTRSLAQPPASIGSKSLVTQVIKASEAGVPSQSAVVRHTVAQPAGSTNPPSQPSVVRQPVAQPAGNATNSIAQPSRTYPQVDGTTIVAQPTTSSTPQAVPAVTNGNSSTNGKLRSNQWYQQNPASYAVTNGTSSTPQAARVLSNTPIVDEGTPLVAQVMKSAAAAATPQANVVRQPIAQPAGSYSAADGTSGVAQPVSITTKPAEDHKKLSIGTEAKTGEYRLGQDVEVLRSSGLWIQGRITAVENLGCTITFEDESHKSIPTATLQQLVRPLAEEALSQEVPEISSKNYEQEDAATVTRRGDQSTPQDPFMFNTSSDAHEPDEEDPALAKLVASLSASDRLPVGANVEYFEKKGNWLPATVLGFDDLFCTYKLDMQPYALAGHVRVPGILEYPPNVWVEKDVPVVEDGEPVGGDGGGGGEDATPKAQASVPQFTVQKQKEGGRTVYVVFIEANDGCQIRAFDGDCTNFMLSGEAVPMRKWLDGISNAMMPGLLTLLQYEVNCRNAALQEMQKEKDSYSGQDAFEFFGLKEDATDKEITRAYREKAKELHPDKGGDEEEFDEMRRKYEQLKENASGDSKKAKAQGEGDPLSWDPSDRASMLTCHDRMREFLVWVSKDVKQTGAELEEMRRRQADAASKQGTLLDDGQVAEEECPSTSAAPAPRGPVAPVS